MLTLVLSLVAATLATTGIKLAFPGSTWSLALPFFGTLFGVGVLLIRRVTRLVEPVVEEAQRHLLAGRREQAEKALTGGLRFGRWHPLIASQLRTQLGALHYDAGKLDDAERELARASRWPWMSRALLGCVYFKKREPEKMRKAFDTMVKVGDKEPLAFTLYAHCLLAQGERERAVKVIEAGLKNNPGDGRLETNLELAREGKKLKTAPYGDKWSRFGLGGEGPVVPHAARGFAVRPGFRQRPKHKR